MRVLFLTHRLPFAPDRGDRIRAYHMLRTLTRIADVELLSLVHSKEEAKQVGPLRATFGIEITPVPVPYVRTRLSAVAALAGTMPLTHALLDSPVVSRALASIVSTRPPDLVLAYCSGMAKFAMQTPLADFPLVVDLVDLDSAKWDALAGESRAPMRWIYRRESRYLSVFERVALRRARATLVVNDREADAVRLLEPRANVQVVRNGVDIGQFTPSDTPVDAPRVVFCGVMDYGPNVDGVLWFAREVWPEVKRACPAATFTIVGSSPTERIRRLADQATGIEVTGRVPEVVPYLRRSAIAVAPLRIARGVQNKVLEAVAAGLPTVVTNDVFQGLPNEVRIACALGDNAREFTRQTIRLLRMPGGERRALANRADCRALDWDHQMQSLTSVLATVYGLAARREQRAG
jgi:sugar transferase (PEP-CTERM/EpsH1 system associated)